MSNVNNVLALLMAHGPKEVTWLATNLAIAPKEARRAIHYLRAKKWAKTLEDSSPTANGRNVLYGITPVGVTKALQLAKKPGEVVLTQSSYAQFQHACANTDPTLNSLVQAMQDVGAVMAGTMDPPVATELATPAQVEATPATSAVAIPAAQPELTTAVEPPFNLNDLVSGIAENLSLQIVGLVKTNLRQWLGVHLQEMVRETVPALMEELKQNTNGQQPPRPPEPKEKRTRLPKICVTGLLPVQAGQIQTEFYETFDIVFWDEKQGNSFSQLRTYADNCEVVFNHTRHSSHAVENTLKSVGAKIIRVNGTVGQMRDALTKYYCERQPTP